MATLPSLQRQEVPQALQIILINDASTDGTGTIARRFAETNPQRLDVLDGKPRPPGWSGKLWAVTQGIAEAGSAEFILLTDADITHDPRHVATLVARAEQHDLDLVLEMVTLACDTPAERALVPAFVYFFQLLHPFAWVNDPLRATAAAAGGTVLIRRCALHRIGGIEAVRGALIDDVALAAAVKRGGRVRLDIPDWRTIRAIRMRPIFVTCLRTADCSLLSPTIGSGTVLGMCRPFLPRRLQQFGHGLSRWFGWLAWGCMAASYQPTLHRYHRSVLWAPLLPVGRVLHRCDDWLSGQPLPRPWGHLEGTRLSGRGCMSQAATVETWSGKDRGDENFPVGSLLNRRDLRSHVHAFYAFARNADDIADSDTLVADEKVARLTLWKMCCWVGRTPVRRVACAFVPAWSRQGLHRGTRLTC